jgi:hypothetical protein
MPLNNYLKTEPISKKFSMYDIWGHLNGKPHKSLEPVLLTQQYFKLSEQNDTKFEYTSCQLSPSKQPTS